MTAIDHPDRTPASADGVELQSYDEAVVGESDIGLATSRALRALAKASRACLLYDFDNHAVEQFLKELDYRLEHVLANGPMELEVRPWELLRAGEVVYRDPDREKSLAYRLYRDGVRQLTLGPQVTWDEVVRLIEILSLRYTGIRQQEDDVVTMLWKSDFEHVQMVTVSRFAAVSDDELGDRSSLDSLIAKHMPPGLLDGIGDFQHPWPDFHDHVEIDFEPLAAEQLEAVAAEDDPARTPELGVRLAELLLAEMTSPRSSLSAALCLPLLKEIRDALLDDGPSEPLQQLIRVVLHAAGHVNDPAERRDLLEVFTGADAFAALIDASINAGAASSAAVEILGAASKQRLPTLLNTLASRWSGTGGTVCHDILRASLGPRISELGDVALAAPAAVGAALLEDAAELEPDFATHLALAMVRRQDRSLQLKALDTLDRLPYRSEIGRVLTDVPLRSEHHEVCRRAAEVLTVKGERRAAPQIRRAVERLLANPAEAERTEPLMVALARLAPANALALIDAWIEPHGLLGRLRSAPSPLWSAAVSALAWIPGRAAGDTLSWIESRATGELKTRCREAIVRQRELARHDE